MKYHNTPGNNFHQFFTIIGGFRDLLITKNRIEFSGIRRKSAGT